MKTLGESRNIVKEALGTIYVDSWEDLKKYLKIVKVKLVEV